VSTDAHGADFPSRAWILGRVSEKTRPHADLSHPPDAAIAVLAATQAGVVSTRQLLAAGLTKDAVYTRVRAGRLHRVHPGVYVVGVPRLTPTGRHWAAILARGGPGQAALSHRSAAGVWDLLDAGWGPVDVTTRRQSVPAPGIRTHRSRTLDWATDITTLNGLPLTTVARTLIDLADVLTPYQLERVIHRAAHLNLLDVAAINPPPGRRSRALTAALHTLADDEPRITTNDLEEAMLALVHRANLPAPRCQVPLLDGRYTADFFWPDHDLVAETDGGDHLRRPRYEHDRERDALMLLAGYRVVRFTWRQLTERPDYVVATLRALLLSPASPARP
jgi:very-short-patch-repair endonuclease